MSTQSGQHSTSRALDPAHDLSGALLDLSAAASRVANLCIGQRPPDGTPAGLLLAAALDGPDWTTSSVRRAHEGLLSADLAGIDHLRAMAALLRSPVATSVSVATVTRGAAEAFSRVHWMLTASSAAMLVLRHLSLVLSDIQYAGRLQPDVPLRTGVGGSLAVEQYKQQLQSRLKAYGHDKPAPVGRTALAAAVLDDAVHDGRVKYSQLSSVAHGESIAVNAFIDLDSPLRSATREMTMHLPLTFAIEYVAYALLTCAKQHNALIEHFSPPAPEIERWAAIRDRAVARFRAVDITHRA